MSKSIVIRSPKELHVSHLAWGLALLATVMSNGYAHGQNQGENIQTEYGFLSAMTSSSESSKDIYLHPPVKGADYEIKVYFLKVETSAFAIDAYYDSLNAEAKKQGKDSGSVVWDKLRGGAERIESMAHFEVFDADGRSVGRVDDIGLIPFFKTIRLKAVSPRYRVLVRCTKGAGLFRLVFEYD